MLLNILLNINIVRVRLLTSACKSYCDNLWHTFYVTSVPKHSTRWQSQNDIHMSNTNYF